MGLSLTKPATVDTSAPAAPDERVKYLILRDQLNAEGDKEGVAIASAAYNGEADAVAACDAEIARRAPAPAPAKTPAPPAKG